MTDSSGNVRNATFDMFSTDSEISESLNTQFLESQCSYDNNDLTILLREEMETDVWPLYPKQAKYGVVPYCGNKVLRGNSDTWTYVFHQNTYYAADEDGNRDTFNLLQDENQVVCFAYYEKFDKFRFYVSAQDIEKEDHGPAWMDGPELNLNAGAGNWGHTCLKFHELLKSTSSLIDWSGLDTHGNMTELDDVMQTFRQLNLHHIQGYTTGQFMIVDDFVYGILPFGDGSPTRTAGIQANDGGAVLVDVSKTSDTVEVIFYRPAGEIEGHQCNWLMPSIEVMSVGNSSDLNTNFTQNGVKSNYLWGSNSSELQTDHYELPNTGFHGSLIIDGTGYSANSVSAADIVNHYSYFYGESVAVEMDNSCDKTLGFTVEWNDRINADMRNWDYSSISASVGSVMGENSSSTTSTPGVWLKRFPGQMLRASFDEPQVRVEVGDSGAICKITSGCDFSFTEAYTVSNVDVSVSSYGAVHTIVITTVENWDVSDFDTLFIGGKAVNASMQAIDATSWGFTVRAYDDEICAGRQQMRIKMTDGDAKIDCTDCAYLDVELVIDGFDSTTGSVLGATRISVQGYGFCESSFDHVFVQKGPDSGVVPCKMAELVDYENCFVHVPGYVESFNDTSKTLAEIQAFVFGTFQIEFGWMNSSTMPFGYNVVSQIDNIDISAFSANGGSLVITGTSFGSEAAGSVFVNDDECVVDSWSATSVNCTVTDCESCATVNYVKMDTDGWTAGSTGYAVGTDSPHTGLQCVRKLRNFFQKNQEKNRDFYNYLI